MRDERRGMRDEAVEKKAGVDAEAVRTAHDRQGGEENMVLLMPTRIPWR